MPKRASKKDGETIITKFRVMATLGIVRIGQVALAMLVTATPQMLRPVAVEVLVEEQ
jgi:hypothetical protein